MHASYRFIALSATLTFTGLVMGCEDSAAKQRVATQKEIERVASEFRSMPRPQLGEGQENPLDKQISTLNQLATSLAQATGGSPGQMASASLLAAALHHEIAQTTLAKAEAMEASLRLDRSVLHSLVDAAITLDTLAKAYGSMNTSQERAVAEAAAAEANARLTELRTSIASMEEPMESLRQRIGANRQKATSLLEESEKLKQQALDSGAWKGFPTFEQAVSLQADADEIHTSIALSEIELAELEPGHSLDSALAAQTQSNISEFKQVIDQLNAVTQATKDQAQECQKAADLVRAEFEKQLAAVAADASGPLAELYTSAASHLDKAEQAASRASSPDAGRDGQGAAKLEQARILMTRGGLAAAQARGYAGHVELLRRAADAGDALGAASARSSEADQLARSRDESTTAAVDAFTAASDSVGSAGMPPEAAERIRVTMAMAITAVKGAAAPAASGAAGVSGASGSAPVFATADELLAALRALDLSDPAQIQMLASLTRAETPQGQQSMEMNMKAINAFTGVMSALREKFPDAGPALTGAMAAPGMPSFSSITVTSQTDDAVEASAGGQPIHLVKVGDRWMIDGDKISAQEAMMMGMMAPRMDALQAAAEGIAARIRAGEFPSVEAAMTAFQQEAAKAIMGGGMPAGMGGSPDADPQK